jgi:hypothetical protein
LGYAEGTLSCSGNCEYDLSGCSGLLWFLNEDFDGGTASNWSYNDDWELGTPSGAEEPDPYSGQLCAGTVMGGDYNDSATFEDTTLVSPEVDLTAATAPVLTFYQYIDSEGGWDGGNVWVSDDNGVNWTLMENNVVEPDYYDDDVDMLPAYSGDHSSLGWHQVSVDLDAYKGDTIRIRFSFFSDSIISSYPGWYIDDVLISD